MARIMFFEDTESRRLGKVYTKTSPEPLNLKEMILFPLALIKLAKRLKNDLNKVFMSELVQQEVFAPEITINFSSNTAKKQITAIKWKEDVNNAVIIPVDIDRTFTVDNAVVTEQEGYIFKFDIEAIMQQVLGLIPSRAMSRNDRQILSDSLHEMLIEYYDEQTMALQSRFA